MPSNIIYAFLFSPIRATFPDHLILLDLIILIVLGEEYKLRSSSLYSFLQPPVTSSLFGPNFLTQGQNRQTKNSGRKIDQLRLFTFKHDNNINNNNSNKNNNNK
jgi:hypothetical protein